jgi:hypothetical protein
MYMAAKSKYDIVFYRGEYCVVYKLDTILYAGTEQIAQLMLEHFRRLTVVEINMYIDTMHLMEGDSKCIA